VVDVICDYFVLDP